MRDLPVPFKVHLPIHALQAFLPYVALCMSGVKIGFKQVDNFFSRVGDTRDNYPWLLRHE